MDNRNFGLMVTTYLSNYDKISKIQQRIQNTTDPLVYIDLKKIVNLNKQILVYILQESLKSRLKNSNRKGPYAYLSGYIKIDKW